MVTDGGAEQPALARPRPEVRGKFIFVGDEKLYVRGVTYGTFRPSAEHGDYPAPDRVDADFRQMAASGVNAVRTYTVPPVWLLDAALRHGLYVMAGLPWEQHVAFLDDRERAASIEERVRAGARRCAGHPALLCFAVGNEIPASIVRWHGPRAIERFLARLHRAVKQEDPGALVTYVNFPSTEYLDLSFVDFVCFNVYLEQRERLDGYLARLQSLAGPRPLVMAEIGLDSRRNGRAEQARTLAWQLDAAFAAGCAGAFVFAWTDEWHRGGYDIDDWDFGLTDRERQPKPALAAVGEAFAHAPLHGRHWPRASVVVCSYNGAQTLAETLEHATRLDYPDYEVIVVDDGSTDDTPVIAAGYDVRLVTTENRGLSAARNVGCDVATGEVVAYVDDDAWPDRHWLKYMVAALLGSDHAGVGGPNLAPDGDGPIADCVAHAPGGPIHVMLSDTVAEHVPGCNMAWWRERYRAVGGFDPQFRVAGDDVDFCWRIQQRGWTIGFAAAAVVWHHRRNSLRAYLRQQHGYGVSEAMLERKWPDKYNAGGSIRWGGRLYGNGLVERITRRRGRIYFGTWGTGLFQSVYREPTGLIAALPQMPEWYMLIAVMAVIAAAGALWTPLLVALPLLAAAVAPVVWQALVSAARVPLRAGARHVPWRLRALTAFLYLAQPIMRLWGRMRSGLTPWRASSAYPLRAPRRRRWTHWDERWRPCDDRLLQIERALLSAGGAPKRGSDFSRWDLHVRGGTLGAARARLAVEEHGAGRQLVLVSLWPKVQRGALVIAGGLLAASVAVALTAGLRHAALLLVLAIATAIRSAYESAGALAMFERALGMTAAAPDAIESGAAADAIESGAPRRSASALALAPETTAFMRADPPRGSR